MSTTQVISRNPFDLLGEGGETPAAPAPAPKATPAAPKAAREVPGSKAPANNNKSSDATRGGRAGYYPRGGARNVLKGDKSKPATDAETTTVDPESGFEGERRAPGKNERGQARPRGHGEGSGRGRATRTPRGRGGQAGGLNGGERRNDGRRSAHAHPDSEKRVASGWGAEDGTAELTAEVEGAVDANKEAAEPQTPTGETAPAVEETAAEKKPEEEEDNTKSYEEYLAERKAAQKAELGKLEGRTVEGTSDFVGSVFQRKEEEEFFSGPKKEKAAAAKKEKERKEKVFLEVEGKFAPPSRGEGREGGRGGARGGRGGFRGDRGSDRPRGAARGGARGGARNANSNGPTPSVTDESAFPALGA